MSLLDIPLDRVLDEIEYVPAYWIREEKRTPTRYIVVHAMGRGTATPNRARNNASYFANGSGGRKASTQMGVDDREAIRSAPDTHGVYGAAGTNFNGLHIEFAGGPELSTDDWLDDYGAPCLGNGAYVMAAWSQAFGIPLEHVGVDGLLDPNGTGVVTHWDCSQAFEPGGHDDPWNLPLDHLLRTAQAYLQEDWLAMASPEEVRAIVREEIDARVFRSETVAIVRDPRDGSVLWVYRMEGGHIQTPAQATRLITQRGARNLGDWEPIDIDMLNLVGPTEGLKASVDELVELLGEPESA